VPYPMPVAKRAAQVQLATIARKLDRFEHELCALDVSFNTLMARGLFANQAAAARQDLIDHVRQRLARLRLAIGAQAMGDEVEVDLSLPRLEECQGDELSVVNSCLDQRLHLTRELHTTLARYLPIVSQVAAGRIGSFRLVWWLARLKRDLDQVERSFRRLGHDEGRLGNASAGLLKAIGGQRNAARLAGNVNGLMQLFGDIDAMAGRIAKLQAAVAAEESRVDDMRVWLASNDAQASEVPVNSTLPPIFMAQELEDATRSPHLKGLAKNEERLTLARRFIASFVAKRDGEIRPGGPESRPPKLSRGARRKDSSAS